MAFSYEKFLRPNIMPSGITVVPVLKQAFSSHYRVLLTLLIIKFRLQLSVGSISEDSDKL
jgi:hypothetical protein